MLLPKSILVACAAIFAFQSLAVPSSAVADSDRPLSKTTFDPTARQVDMFQAMDDDDISVKVVPRNSTGGSLFITNKADEPLTVKAPKGFVGVPVNAQMGMGGMGGMGMGGGMGGMGGGMGGMGGGMQAMGGGMGGMGGGMGGMGGGMGGMGGGMGGMGGGGGFFSIPPQKTLRLPYTSVCLNHGLKDPTPGGVYLVVPVERYTDNTVLQSLIEMVGSGQLDQRSAQAATWNVANGMSWQQLANESESPFPAPGSNYFSAAQMKAAQQIVATAHTLAAQKSEETKTTEPAPETTPVRVRRTR